MKVLVIGSTGSTGKHAVPKLLARGDEVTAFARTPSAITITHERLRVVQGDATDRGSIDRALVGQDAVFVAFGPRSLGKTNVQEVLMQNLVPAMQAAAVLRIVNLSSRGAGDSDAGFVFRVLRATMLRNVFDDKERAEKILLGSALDYVNVRPGRLIEEPARGGVLVSKDGAEQKPLLTYEDLATFMITQLDASEWVRKSPVIGYRR